MTGTTLRSVAALLTAIIVAACGTSGASSTPPITPPAPTPPAAAITAASPSPTAAATLVSPSPSATHQPTPRPTPVPAPPKPTGATFASKVRVSDDEATAKITQTVTWQAPRSKGVEIQVYGVTECIARPADPLPDTSGPCLVEHTPLPSSVRTLLTTAPASDGVVSWTWTEETGCDPGLSYDPEGPAYYAIVLAAYNASGHSIFAIAEPGRWVGYGPNDVIC